ncbi:MAG TPA: Rad52/Rad22 family DNA repair protein, partial [Terriglobales bacterium]|nr:Rad52/Rad22 family DNA repair protein [Terriglobales bacterium]
MSAPNGHAGSSSTGRVDGTENAPAVVNNLSTQLSTERLATIIAELAVPFAPSLIEWRVTNTTKDKARGQVIPYADQRAYIDRLTALVTPAGWTRKYSVHTSANFERSKDQKTIAKVLVTCELTIFGIGSHSATGEAWSDDENASTSAEAQAFKRAAACFGLGRYLYYFRGIWVDLDAHKRPKKLPKLPLWATPEAWRKGMRPENESQGSSEAATRSGTNNDSPARDEVSDE